MRPSSRRVSRTPWLALARLAVLGLIVCSLLPVWAGNAGPAPRPIGPDGRAQYRLVTLLGLSEADFGPLVLSGFDLEQPQPGVTIAYVTAEELDKLEALGISWREIDDTGSPGWRARQSPAGSGPLGPDAPSYHNYTQVTNDLQAVANAYPGITRLTSAGQTVQGREMWWLKITDNPTIDEDEPGFKYVSTMHGDEPIGTEMLFRLIDWLTTNYGIDPRATRIVDNVEIWIMPMMNPDGNTLSQRYNAAGVDLNRDFPDQYRDPIDTITDRSPEASNIMNWQSQHWTSHSANFHTGAVVANYPYDGTASGANVYSACPDDDVARDISLDYSEDNAPMYNGSFPQGVTNGADWYVLYGGMQDWNYLWRGDMDITIELNNIKWPPATELDRVWNENRESMISYLERALTGVRGIVTDATTGAPLRAELRVEGRGIKFYTDPAVGDYHRLMMPGTFQLTASAAGYQSRTLPVTITNARADARRLDFALTPLPTALSAKSSRVAQDTSNDGYFDPNETGRLAVTLANSGKTAFDLAATLRPLTSYSTVTSGASFPPIPAGPGVESSPPHFGVTTAANTPPGHKLAFAVDWTAAEGLSGTTDAFFVPVGAPQVTPRNSSDTPRAIPDNGQTQSTINVSSDAEIAEVNVRVDIAHRYKGDLRVSLIAPDGTTVRLHDRSGGSADNINTVYDTQTAPVDSLDAFVGKPSIGNWILRVQDLAPGTAGTLSSWLIELRTRPWEDPLPEVLLRGITRRPGETELTWWPVGSATRYEVYRGVDPRSFTGFTNVTSEDPTPSDTRFIDRTGSEPGSLQCFLVSANGYTGEGSLGHYDR